MKRVTYLIDGFNLYHSIRSLKWKKGYKCKWLNINALCQTYLSLFGKDATLGQIFYFSAIPYYLASSKPHRIRRHKAYIRCLEDTEVQVNLGRFKEKDVYCQRCSSMTLTHEEKETDVAIGARLVEVCFQGECEVVVIVSGDTDLLPAVKRCQELFPQKEIVFAFPFDRKSRQLERLSPKSFSISKKQYLRHQFSDPYTLTDGTQVSKPSVW